MLPAAAGGRGLRRALVLRFLFGAFQAGTFPAISRATADWMPTTERGKAQGAIWMSSRLGGAVAPLLLVWLFARLGGWKLPVVLVAAWGWPGVRCSGPGFATVRRRCRRSMRAERKLIQAGRAGSAGHGHESVPWANMSRSVSVWSLCLMYGFLGFSGNF